MGRKSLDLSGQTFGKLTVIELSAVKTHRCNEWVCRCECGKTISVPTNQLRGGVKKQCDDCSKIIRVEDLTGKKYGLLTVLSRDKNDAHGQPTWLCQCDCGEQTTIRSYALRKGLVANCKKCRKGVMIKGKRFGKVTVVQYANLNKHKSHVWDCRCDCGVTFQATTTALKNGFADTCHECKMELLRENRLEDLTGQTFGDWQVIELAGYLPQDKAGEHEGAAWYCKCQCGSTNVVRSNALKTGKSTKCLDCAAENRGREIQDISGEKFALLTAIKPIGMKYGRTLWLCKCDCGNEHEADISRLRNGAIKSCGCIGNVRFEG